MTTKLKQIIAMGGGGFSMEPDNPLLDLYILAQANVKSPKICFLGTASGDAIGYIEKFYAAFAQFDCQPTHVSFFSRTPDLRAVLLNQDIIYVGGGNTKSMLAVWREWGADQILAEAYAAGVVLAGLSAGAICWFEQSITDSAGASLGGLDCLGILAGSACPHYHSEVDRRPDYLALVGAGVVLDGIALDDSVAAHYIDGKLARVVASTAGVSAFQLTRQPDDGTVTETDLQAERLPLL